MRLGYKKTTVKENIKLSDGIYKLSVENHFMGNPGQFYMLRSWGQEPFLSRPISIHDISGGKLSFLFEARGKGTDLLSNLKQGDSIELLGPLGNGFKIEDIKGRVAVVTGGIGIAPMFYTIKSLVNCKIDFYAGFREKVYLADEIRDYVKEIFISTDRGSQGHRGFITEIFDPEKYDTVLCCGPNLMMNKIVESCISKNVQVYASFESHMACGVGACLGCTCKTKEGSKRLCKEGPVLDGREVMLDA